MKANRISRTSAALAALSVSLLTFAAGANAAEHGRVEKNGTTTYKRIARPTPALERVKQNGEAGAGVLGARLKETSLTSGAAQDQLSSTVDLSGWNPWSTTSLRPSASIIAAPFSQQSGLNAELNYADIEKAYADLVPPAPANITLQANTSAPGSSTYTPMLLPSAGGPIPAAVLAAYYESRSRSSVDVDMCECHLPIPSNNCMQMRNVGLYANSTASAPTNNGAAVNGLVNPTTRIGVPTFPRPFNSSSTGNSALLLRR
jgi:hypothetical protein